jgi:hypothetical protein
MRQKKWRALFVIFRSASFLGFICIIRLSFCSSGVLGACFFNLCAPQFDEMLAGSALDGKRLVSPGWATA